MKIVVIGGSGLIGSKTVAILRQGGHEVVAASPKSGVNTITGEGVKEAVAGTQVVIDLANSPSFEDKAVLEFFQAAGRTLLPAEAAAGVAHHVVMSIVGIDLVDYGYYVGKLAQEQTALNSGAPVSIGSGSFWQFNGPPPQASIVNFGQINVGTGGSAFLIAQHIENHGVISAPGGSVGLVSGQQVLLSERPDGRGLSAQVQLPSGSVDNSGRIVADAGTIAVNWVDAWNVVANGWLPSATVAPDTNPAPLTVRAKVSEPAVMLTGLMADIDGAAGA